MNKTLTDRKSSLVLVLVCFLMYTVLSVTRYAYTSAIAGIINDGIFTKAAAGTINSSFYITYGLSQFLGSFYVDKISPFKTISIALIGTVLANIAMSVSSSFAVILIARSFCGLAQFGVWPALLKVISEYISPDYRRKSMYFLPIGLQLGVIISLLLAAVVLKYGNWQDLFTVSYASLAVCTVVFFLTVAIVDKKAVYIEPEKKEKTAKMTEEKSNISTWRVIISSGAIFVFVVALARSLVSAGFESWIPTMLMESYNLSPSFSSILTTITTVANTLAVFVVMALYPKVFKTEYFATGMFFLMMLPVVVAMVFIGKIALIVAIVSIIFANLFRNAIQQFMAVEIPAGYNKYNKAGMMAGLINVFGCIGGAVAGTIFGYTADNFGWNATILSWAVLVFVGMVASFAAIPVWKKFSNTNNDIMKR